tara:strand:+ start:32066 stop:33040 length:975 start_codon:yes stop_codon:yes gene_type:complete
MKKENNYKNVVLFGAGYWGKNHLRELNNCTSVSSIFVVDPFIDSNNSLRDLYPDTLFYDSLENLIIDNHKIDGAIIATPPNTHFEIAKQCLKRNIHVLVEKPMVESLKELEELNNLSKKNNKLLMSGHTYLYNPAIIKMKEIIKDNQIGDIMFIHSQRLNFGIMREETDVFLSLAPHDISLVQFFLNDQAHINLSNQKSNFTFSPYSDFSSTLLEYDNNVSAKIDVSWYYPEKIRSLKIIGTKKTLVFDDVLKTIKLHDISIKNDYSHNNNGIEEITFDSNISPLTNEIKEFLGYFSAPNECITGYEHTRNVIKVIEEYYMGEN